MVHKKYTYKNGKRYGPYYYENKRLGNKIVTTYLGSKPPEMRRRTHGKMFKEAKWVLPLALLILVGTFLLIYNYGGVLYSPEDVSRIEFSKPNYVEGEILDGIFVFRVFAGELIPADSVLYGKLGEREVDFILSDLFLENEIYERDYYLSGSGLTGSGEGFGVVGEKEEFPEVSFQLEVYQEGVEEPDIEPETGVSNGGKDVIKGPLQEEEVEVIPVNPEGQVEGSVEEIVEPEVSEDSAPDSEDSESSSDGGDLGSDSDSGDGSSEGSLEGSSSGDSGASDGGDSSSGDSGASDGGGSGGGDSETYSGGRGSGGGESSESSSGGDSSGESVSLSPGTIIDGIVSSGNDFRLELEEGENVRIVEGSVSANGEGLDEEEISLNVVDGAVVVSTDYSIIEEGFGEEYLGNDFEEFVFELSEFGFAISEEDDLDVQVVFDEFVLFSNSERVLLFEGEINETNQTGLNETEEVPVDDVLSESGLVQKPAKVGEPVCFLHTKDGLGGKEIVVFDIPNDGVIKNVEKVVMEKPVDEVSQGVLGPGQIQDALDVEAQNGELDGSIEAIENGGFDEEIQLAPEVESKERYSAHEIVLEGDVEKVVLEWCAPPVLLVSEEVFDNKVVAVYSGSEIIHYENIGVLYDVPEEFLEIADQARVYLGGTFISSTFNPETGMLEWVSDFSNQTFEIIFISHAEHLDSNKTFVEDIYDYVKERDDNWTTIPAGHYVRVKFDEELDSSKDITIHARSNGSAKVEVYEVNGTEKLAEFGSVTSESEQKIYLTSLVGLQDTFDLLILGDEVEFDYIVDPVGNVPQIEFDADTSEGLILGNSFYVNLDTLDENYHYSFVDLNRDVVLWMSMEDRNISNDTTDLSTYSNNGTSIGTALIQGQFGNATGFGASSSSYIKVPSLSNAFLINDSSMTVSLKVKTTAVSKTLIADYGSTGGGLVGMGFDIPSFQSLWGWQLFIDSDGRVAFQGNGNGNSAVPLPVTSSVTINNNNWAHVVLIEDRESGRSLIYVNGYLRANGTGRSRAQHSSREFYIGPKAAAGLNPSNFAIDDVIVFNRTINQDEVRSLYVAYSNPPYSSESNQYFRNFTNMTYGNYTFKGFVVDQYGNKNQTGVNEVILSNLPLIILNAPENESEFFIGSGNITLNASVYSGKGNLSEVNIFAAEKGYSIDRLVHKVEELESGDDVVYNITALPVDPLSEGLVLLLNFDNRSDFGETDGFAYDFSGNGNDGGYWGGNTKYVKEGKFGYAADFDGDNDYIWVNDDSSISGMSEVTLSIWFKVDQWFGTGDTFATLAGKSPWGGINNNREYRIRYERTKNLTWFVSADGNDSGYSADVSYPTDQISVGEWHHVVGTWSNETGGLKFYVDGSLVAEGIFNNKSLFDGNSNFSVGSSGDNGAYPLHPTAHMRDDFNGSIDEVAVWNRALSEEEIKNLYRLNIGKYEWKVNVTDSEGVNSTSEFREFEVLDLPALEISSCPFTLSDDGRTYHLNQDLTTTLSSSCLTISANDITLDGQGHSISYTPINPTLSTKGISTLGAHENIVVKNVKTSNFGIGIHFNDVENGTLMNNTIIHTTSNAVDRGLVLENSNSSLIEGNSFFGEFDYGIISSNSHGNDFLNNLVSQAQVGVVLEESTNNLLRRGVVNSTNNHAIYLTGTSTSNNTISNFSIKKISTNSNVKEVYVANGVGITNFVDMQVGKYQFTGNLISWENSSNGKIEFLEPVSWTGNNLSRDIEVNYDLAKVNASTGLNKSALITLYNLPGESFDNPFILRNKNQICNETTTPSCHNFTSLKDENVTFNVSSWSDYSVRGDIGITSCPFRIELDNTVYTLENDLTGIIPGICLLVLADNVTINGDGHGIFGGAIGLQDLSSPGLRVENTTFKNMNIGVITSGKFSTIDNNYFENDTYGIIFFQGQGNVLVQNNIINKSSEGISTLTIGQSTITRNISIINNTFFNNTFGANLYNLQNSSIEGSVFEGNSIGLNLSRNSTNNYIYANIFANNNNGLLLEGRTGYGSPEDNYLVNNNFSGNRMRSLWHSYLVRTNYLIYNNSFGEIYWADDFTAKFANGLTFSHDLSVEKGMEISHNLVSLNLSYLAEGFNSSTNIILRDIGEISPFGQVILKDGMHLCDETTTPSCRNSTPLNATDVKFSVSSWSNYSIGEIWYLDILSPTQQSPKDVTADENLTVSFDFIRSITDLTDDIKVNEIRIGGELASLNENQLIFMDSFEGGGFSGDWQADFGWDICTSGHQECDGHQAIDGSFMAHVDGVFANEGFPSYYKLVSLNEFNLSNYLDTDLSAYVYLNETYDSGEYICLDYSCDGGSTWNNETTSDGGVGGLCQDGDIDIEGVFRKISLDPLQVCGQTSEFVFRFRAYVSNALEDGLIDSVIFTGSGIGYDPHYFGGQWNVNVSLPDSLVPGLYDLSVNATDEVSGFIRFDIENGAVNFLGYPVSGCRNLDEEGAYYILNENLNNLNTNCCINITADNVIFDGGGNYIDGPGGSTQFAAVCAQGVSGVQIKNLTVKEFGDAFRFNGVNFSLVEESNITNNYGRAFYELRGFGNIFENNDLRFNFGNSPEGRRLFHLSEGTNITLRNNTLLNNKDGLGGSVPQIYLEDTNKSFIEDNFISDHFGDAISLWDSHYNFMSNNRAIQPSVGDSNAMRFESGSSYNYIFNFIADRHVHGFRLINGPNNYFEGGSLSNIDNGQNGNRVLYLETGSHNNTFKNIMISGTGVQSNDRDLYIAPNVNGTVLEDIGIGRYNFTSNLVTFRNSSSGEIRYLETISGENISLKSDVIIISGFAIVNSSKSGLNKSANIILTGLDSGITTPSVLRDGVRCDSAICSPVSILSPGNFSFNVTHWTNYSIKNFSNVLPIVNLENPEDNNTTTDRTPLFNWIVIDSDEDEVKSYLNITCHYSPGGSDCSDDNRLIEIDWTNETVDSWTHKVYDTLANETKYFIDDGRYYNWTVRAHDGFGFGPWAQPRRLNIQSVVEVNLSNNNITFYLAPGENDDTMDNVPQPFVLDNLGNVKVNVSINGTTSLWDAPNENPSDLYQYYAPIWGLGGFRPVPNTTSEIGIINLNHSQQINPSAIIHLNVTVPENQGAGRRDSTILFVARRAE